MPDHDLAIIMRMTIPYQSMGRQITLYIRDEARGITGKELLHARTNYQSSGRASSLAQRLL